MSYRPGDSKREEFRKYLEKAGVLDTLTKALVKLYEEPERPVDAMGFIKEKLKVSPDAYDVETMRQEIQDLKHEIERLNLDNNRLKQRIDLETPPATPGE